MERVQHSRLTRKRGVTSGTKEWADHNVNCVKGCYNNCRYCYAKMMAKRFGRATDLTWKRMKVRREAVSKTYRKLQGRVMFPSSHDIIDFPRVERACHIVLQKLLESGNNVLITTKPRFKIVKKIDKSFSQYKQQLQFRFTITSNNNDLLGFWEPNAPRFEERMDSLRYTFDKKYKTSVSVEPFLDYLPHGLVKTAAPYSTESIWIGKMNYIPRQNITRDEAPFYDEIRKNYETDHLKEIYHDLKDMPKVRFKDSIRIMLDL